MERFLPWKGYHVWQLFLWQRNERGIVLATALILMVLLAGVSASALFSSYLNSVTTTNLKMAAQAQGTAEAGANEALYRLSRQEGQPGALVPDLTQTFWQNPNLQIEIDFTTGDTTATDGVVSTIQPAGDWPVHKPADPVLIRYKKNESNNKVLFYDRTVNPPFKEFTLPNDANTGSIPDTAHPIFQIRATGRDERGAERQVLLEAVGSSYFAPPAPLSSGIDVNLGGAAYIDGVNHSHLIVITNGSGSAAMYGDASGETTRSHTAAQGRDSPDDNSPSGDGIANPSALLAWDSPARTFNMQISDTDTRAAWEGLAWIQNPTSASNPPTLTTPGGNCTGAPLNHPNTPHWHGTNIGFASPVALSTGPDLLGVPGVTGNPIDKGVFSWRMNITSGGMNPPSGTPCLGATTLVCRPSVISHAPDEWDATPNHFPSFQEYLGLDDSSFQRMLDTPDTCAGSAYTGCPASQTLSSSNPPLGFTYIKMPTNNDEFNLASIAAPDTNDFGLMYVKGSLRMPSNFVYKGLIFVEGSMNIVGNPTVLGAIMVRGATSITDDTFGAGNARVLYSRKAAELGIQAGHPWRILSWQDTEMAS